MISQEEIQKRIEQNLTGSTVEVRDLTGTSDHFQVTIVCPLFEGQSMINQHRLVKAIFDKDIASGALHALSLKTFTPAEWAKRAGLN